MTRVMLRRLQCPLLRCPLLALAVSTAASHSTADVRPRVESVPCVPGGVAAIPVERTPGEPWPSRVAVRIGDLRSTAPIVWVGPRADDGVRTWTRSEERVDATMIAEVSATPEPESTGEVFAMVSLPVSGEGAIEVAGSTVRAAWLPVPRRLRADAPVLSIPATIADDRPDPTTPAEHWRWSLLAERQGARIGDPRGDAADRLLAQYLAGLWLAGLERVRGASPGVHAELAELLTGTSEDLDHGRTVGAWIARTDELRSLLGILVDEDRTPQDAAQAALTWARNRWTCTAWVEEDAGDRVLVAVANPLGGERVLRAEWTGGAGQSVPTAIVAKPRRITRTWLDRPGLQPSADPYVVDRMRAETLELSDGAARTRLAIGAREYPVQPPALSFGTFVPALTLAEAQAGSLQPSAGAWRTTASLRKREGRWELFAEAFRPAGVALADEDRLTVRLGDPAAPTHAFVVSGDGTITMIAGPDDGVAAGFMAWQDRWRARIELPESWLPPLVPGARPLLVSVERVPGAGEGRQTAGLARPSWTASAGPILVDLGAWDDLGR